MQVFPKKVIIFLLFDSVFRILPDGPPSQLRGCQVTNHSLNSIFVQCVPGNANGHRQWFQLELYERNSPLALAANMSNTAPRFYLSNLAPGTKLTLKIYAANPKGSSQPLILPAETLFPPERHTDNGKRCEWSKDFKRFFLRVNFLLKLPNLLVNKCM